MRPIKLTMTAFGPYKGTEVVNFEELDGNDLFVISGATGAGKTTIFDGICFALYGQASGEDRTEIRAMRSDFADRDVQTTVELTFLVHNRMYRIMRQIPYIKPGNKSETPGRVEFFEQDGEREIPVVDRQIVSEVNRKVEEIIGFTEAQFSQIVMLPQGEFRKFLTSDTENKETIMRKIFKTEPYVQIVDKLKIEKDEAQATLIAESSERDSHVKNIPTILPKRESLLFEVLAMEYPNTHQVVEGLQEEFLYYEKKLYDDQLQYKEAYEAHEKTLSNYFEAKNVNERFQELEQQQAELKVLTARLPEFEMKEKRLEAAERTIAIEQIEYQFREIEKEVSQKQDILTKAKVALEKAIIGVEQAEVAFTEEAEKKTEREKLAESLMRLHDALPLVKEIAMQKQKIQEMSLQQDRLQGALVAVTETASVEKKKVLAYEQNMNQLEEIVLPLDMIVVELNEVKEISEILERYIAYSQQVSTLKETRNIQSLTYEKEKEAYDSLANAWLMNEAATMAETLRLGEHCPVCGSTEHPKKAHAIEGTETVSKGQVETAKKQLDKVEREYQMAVAKYENAVEQLEIQRNVLLEVNINVDHIEAENEACKLAKEALEKELTFMRKSREELKELKERFKKQHEIAEKALQKQAELERTSFEQQMLLEKEQSLYAHAIKTISEDTRDLESLQVKIEQLTRKKEEMDRAWESAQRQREKVNEQLTISRNNTSHAEASVNEARVKKERAAVRFQEALANSSFSTEVEYEEAKMEVAERLALKKELEQFKQRRYMLIDTVAQLKENLEGKKKEDIAGLEITLAGLKEIYEKMLSEVNRSKGYKQATKDLQQTILALTERVAQLERKFGKVANLYDVVRGQNNYRLSFERYIQIEYLERIIQSANERLIQLSNGQFEFVRSERQEGRGRQSGLSLDVYDAYTGQTRDVKTLSGGEKFNAALCLALGMADVIQSFQGSISIDTMFIDEGFGSLDEESLNKAIDTLIELQKSGRMIGVISHVEELKAALPAILEVKKSKEGHSSTKFLVK